MSHSVNLHTTDGVIAQSPAVGYTLGAGATPPADNTVGWAPGAIWIGTDKKIYRNDGTKSAADFNETIPSTSLLATIAELNRAADVSTRIVPVTASTLAVTVADHDGKILELDRAAGIAITLPSLADSLGAVFKFRIKTTFTGASSIKSVASGDIMVGHALMGNNSDNSVVDWQALASDTFDTIDLFTTGNTTGGFEGQEVEIIGGTGRWYVSMRGDAAGSEATPFQNTVS